MAAAAQLSKVPGKMPRPITASRQSHRAVDMPGGAEEQPDLLRQAPQRTKVRRLDEVQAARCPCLIGPTGD